MSPALLLAVLTAHAEPGALIEVWSVSRGTDLSSAAGHTMLRVKTVESDRVYDFGRYDADAAFAADMVRGELKFRLKSAGVKATREWLIEKGRSISTRAFDVPAATAQEMREALAAIDAAENGRYSYDPATANCVTRVRDLLDEHLFHGAWSAANAGPGVTWKEGVDHVLADAPVWRWAVGAVNGPLWERPVTAWTAIVMPYQLDEAIDRLGPDALPPGVTLGPTVVVHDTGDRPGAPRDVMTSPIGGIIALLLASTLPALVWPADARARRALIVGAWAWAVLGGALGTTLWLIQSQTSPVYRGNLVLLGLHPALWLWGWAMGRAESSRSFVAVALCAGVATAGLVGLNLNGQGAFAQLGPIAALEVLSVAAIWRVRAAS